MSGENGSPEPSRFIDGKDFRTAKNEPLAFKLKRGAHATRSVVFLFQSPQEDIKAILAKERLALEYHRWDAPMTGSTK